MVGKVLGKIIQDRLKLVAEDVLPDSQYGFKVGRGCTDMIFVARQLVEKAWEHHSDLFVLFAGLKMAYNLVPCPTLWRILRRLGIPSTMISIIQSFHEGILVKVIIGQEFTKSFDASNG